MVDVLRQLKEHRRHLAGAALGTEVAQHTGDGERAGAAADRLKPDDFALALNL